MPFFSANYLPVDVVFLGTSITAASPSFEDKIKPLTYHSLETVTNLAVGGSNSWYGLALLEETVQGLAPDLVVLEYVVNDNDTDFFHAVEEATIRRIRELLPSARILFVATPRVADPDVDDATNTDDDVQQIWETLCDAYGVSIVDWSAALYQLINVGGGDLNDYLLDTVHPTATGHQSIAETMLSQFNQALAGGALPAVPDRLYADSEALEDTPVWRDGTDNDGETGTGWSTSGSTRSSSTAEDTIAWDFNGVSCGFYTGAGAGTVALAIDGGAETEYNLANYGNAISHPVLLSDGAHTAVFRVVSGQVDMASFISI